MTLFGSRPPNVEKLRRKGDLVGLRRAVAFHERSSNSDGAQQDSGARIRAESLDALSEFFGPVVAEGVLAGLRDDHPSVRLAAVRAAFAASTTEAVEPLLDGVATWDDPPHGEAIHLALRVLISLGREELPEHYAVQLAHRPSVDLGERQRDALEALLAADARGEVESTKRLAIALIERIADKSASVEVRDRAAKMIGWLGDVGTNHLIAALESGEADAALLRVAGDLRDGRALQPLMAACESNDSEVRTAAATALGALQDTRAVLLLLNATQDEAHTVRQAASRALEVFGVSAVIVGLATAVRSNSDSGAFKRSAEGGQAPLWLERAVDDVVGGDYEDGADHPGAGAGESSPGAAKGLTAGNAASPGPPGPPEAEEREDGDDRLDADTHAEARLDADRDEEDTIPPEPVPEPDSDPAPGSDARTEGEEAGVEESGVEESGVEEAGVEEAGVVAAGVEESGVDGDPPAARDEDAGTASDARGQQATTVSAVDVQRSEAEPTLVAQARSRAAEKSDLELAEMYEIATGDTDEPVTEGPGYWLAISEAVIVEAASRPGFGVGRVHSPGVPRRERRRQERMIKTLRGAASAHLRTVTGSSSAAQGVPD